MLFIGIKTPGYGAEITGSVCLILALIAFGVVGISLGAVVLFALGMVLIVAELKTHIGMLALSGAICMIVASLLLFPSPQWLIYYGVIQQIQEVLVIVAVAMASLFSFIVYKVAKARLSKVKTGKEALDKIEREKYDLALIDVKLPDINGTDLLPIIHSSHPEMIKIVITGFPDLEDANRIMDQGASAYLVKPVKSEELVALINQKLETH